MTEAALAQRPTQEQFDAFVADHASRAIAAMPLNINDADLKRARARLKLAFTEQSAGSGLLECTPLSVARCLAQSAMTGLFPGGHHPDVYLIPRRNRRNGNRKEANWQISYHGYIRLCRRNPGWDLTPRVVFAGETFEYEFGLDPKLIHKPGARAFERPDELWDAIVAGYVVVERPAGMLPRFDVLTKQQIEARRACAKDQDVWNKWPYEQTLKVLCSYAGHREMFPTDDPMRYAMQLDVDAGTIKSAPPEKRLSAADLNPDALPLLPEPEPASSVASSEPPQFLSADLREDYAGKIKELGMMAEAEMAWGKPHEWTEQQRPGIAGQIARWEKEK